MIVGILLLLLIGTIKMVLTPKEKWENDPILLKADELFIVQGTTKAYRRASKLIFILIRYLLVITTLFVKNPTLQINIFLILSTTALFYTILCRPYDMRFFNQVEMASH